jgi:hypothetical protein
MASSRRRRRRGKGGGWIWVWSIAILSAELARAAGYGFAIREGGRALCWGERGVKREAGRGEIRKNVRFCLVEE